MDDERLAQFWNDVDDAQPEHARATLEELISTTALSPARAAFERASLHDYLGEEAAAAPLYRAALDAGLAEPQRTEALIQFGSTLRNLGDLPSAALVLSAVDDDNPLYLAAQAFAALVRHDAGETKEAVHTALHALAPLLPQYGRAVIGYADELSAAPRVRPIAVGVLVRDGHALVEVYPATDRRPAFARAIGGGIMFGETAADAVAREFQEELGCAVASARALGTLENIFQNESGPGHEIAFVFAITAPALEDAPLTATYPIADADSTAQWVPFAELDTRLPFYPPGVADLTASLST